MNFWPMLCGWFSSEPTCIQQASEHNPATGLPMMGDGIGGVDVGGSPWGQDIHPTDISSGFDIGCGGHDPL